MENEKIKVIIYCIIDPFTLKVRYIGRTKLALKVRLHYHLGKAKSYKKKGIRTTHVHNWLNQCVERGKKPIIRKLCEVLGWSESHVVEKQLINKYKDRLVNLDDRGEGEVNKIVSTEQKVKISETLKRKYASGEIVSLSKKEIHVYDLFGNYVQSFDSLAECGNKLDLDEHKLSGVKKGLYKQWKGFQFSEIKVDKMTDITDRQRENWTTVEVLNTETNEILFFKSIVECKNTLELDVINTNISYLPHAIKRKYGDKYFLLIDKVAQQVNIIEPVFIKTIATDEILEFNSLQELGKFLNLSRSKRYKKYLEMNMKRHNQYEFVEMPLPKTPELKKFYK